MYSVRLKNIVKSFEKKRVIKDFSFSFEKEKIYKISGPNGIGKTTLLKIIKGIIIPDKGEISFANSKEKHSSVSYVDSNCRSFLHRLTVSQNLKYFLSLNKAEKNLGKANEILEQFNISHLIDINFSTLSLGQMQIVSFIRSVLEEPDILLLDEVFSNLDNENLYMISDYVNNQKNKGNSIIYCSHGVDLPLNVNEEIKLY